MVGGRIIGLGRLSDSAEVGLGGAADLVAEPEILRHALVEGPYGALSDNGAGGSGGMRISL